MLICMSPVPPTLCTFPFLLLAPSTVELTSVVTLFTLFSAHNSKYCTKLYPAMFTFNLLWCVVHGLMLCLFPSLFFFTHSSFFFCFSHSPLACCHFCHHFMKMKNEMIVLIHIASAVAILFLTYFNSSLLAHTLWGFCVCVCLPLFVSFLHLMPFFPSFFIRRPCVSFSLNPPSVNLHVPSLLLFIILTLIHPPFPRLYL